MELTICATCRKKPHETCESTRELVHAAHTWAKQNHQTLKITRETCLSGCIQGLTVLVETPEGSIRCQRVQTSLELQEILTHAEQKIALPVATPIDRLVLSRTNWAEWEAG